MPKQQVVSILDDYDGSELDADTTPLRLTFEDKTYNLYLSEKNQDALRETLAQYTDGAEVVPNFRPVNGGAPAGPSVGPEERKALMEWSRKQDGMKAVAERGRIADSTLKAWNDAGKPGFNE
jgi:hypothetical protein